MATPAPKYRDATDDDAIELAAWMRGEDKAECEALGQSPLIALRTSMAASVRPLALRVGDNLLALFGYQYIPPMTVLGEGVGVPWALTSHHVDRYPKTYFAASRRVVRTFLCQVPVLVQWVDARHARALRWVARLGFYVAEPTPFGPQGVPFCRVTMRGTHG